MTTSPQQLVEVDGRRRVALGRIGHERHTRYLVSEEPDGTVILTPAVVMSTHEEALLRNSDLVAEIRANKADPSRLVESRARRPRSPKQT